MPQSGQFYPYQLFLTPDPTTYFQDNIRRYIPDMYQTGEFEGTIALFETVVAPLLDEMYQRFIDLPKLADVDRCHPKFLQLLAGNINVLTVEDTFNESQTVSFRRQELGKMVDVFKLRGVPASFLRILKYQGPEDYGLIIPRENLMQLDITPVSGSPSGEVNDVNEPLAPQFFDISELADGAYDGSGDLVGSRISYALPIAVIRSAVKLFWNLHEVPVQHEHPDGLLERSFFFDRGNSTITTNFVPLSGDKVIVEVVGDPHYLQSYRMTDRLYWRPGTEEVYSDQNPLLRYQALEDRRPIGTLLYFAWLIKFFISKCFPHPPAIDYQRRGYAPSLPPQQALTWNNLMDCNSPDPWYFQFSNGYGYEAFWEARSSFQHARQLSFRASWATSITELRDVLGPALIGYNLILNSGAEDGTYPDIPNWIVSGPVERVGYEGGGGTENHLYTDRGFPSSVSPGPPVRGKYFFAGGFMAVHSSMSQSVGLSDAPTVVVIDEGVVHYTLSAYIGGWDTQRDNAVLTVTFRAADLSGLGSPVVLGPITPSDRGNVRGLLHRTVSGAVPSGTRSVLVQVDFYKLDGNYCDGYIDNLSLILSMS